MQETPIQMTADELAADLVEIPGATELVSGWLARGDGVAKYMNVDLGSPELGHVQFVSYGSEAAQLETDNPPARLPDIGHAINWRYQLVGIYRHETLAKTVPPLFACNPDESAGLADYHGVIPPYDLEPDDEDLPEEES